MDNMRILVANEPRAYREVMAAAFQELRPHHQVIAVEPDDLDGEVERHKPHLVVCSRLSACVKARLLAWVMLYPDGETRAETYVGGQQAMTGDLPFHSLLSIVDQTERLAQLR